MVCCSLRHDGAELLAQRNGVRAYAQRGSTMGIPLLYPWANRLAASALSRPARRRAARPREPAAEARRATACRSTARSPARCLGAARRRRGRRRAAMTRPARGDRCARGCAGTGRTCWRSSRSRTCSSCARAIDDATLTIETSVQRPPTRRRRCPCPSAITRTSRSRRSIAATWQVELPVNRRLLLDERMIPTGVGEPFERRRFRLADSGWDDAFAGLARPAVFAVSGGGRRIELELARGLLPRAGLRAAPASSSSASSR